MGDQISTGSTKIRSEWQGIILFLALTFAITWGIWLSLRAAGVPFAIRSAIGMFGPALSATLVRLIRREGFQDAGLRLVARHRPRAGWYYLAAYVVAPVLIFAGIVLALLTTYQHWALGANLQSQAHAIVVALAKQGQSLPKGYSAYQLAVLDFVITSVLAFTIAIPFNMIFTFGEEFGWRGYLLPRLTFLGGVPAALITGVVWGLWHAPVIVLDGYNYPGYPIVGVGMMVVFTTALSVIFAWLRFRSGSVWPSTLAHAAINAQAGFGLLVLSTGDALLRSPIGILGLIPMIAFAVWLALTGRVRAETTEVTEEASATS
jgi:uncharacterized protein